MMKVLFFEISDTFGGIESFLLNILRNVNLQNSDIQFDFVTSVKNPAGVDDFKDAGVNIIHISNKKNVLQYYRDLNKLFKDGKYSIVHIQKNSLSNAMPIILARKYHIPYIIHAQNSAPSKNNCLISLLHYLNRSLFAKDATIKLACGNVAAKWMFNSIDGVKIIKNGINPEEFKLDKKTRCQIREKYNASNDLVICNVGRFTDQKNHKFILEIFSDIHKLNNNTKLFLVGDGSNMNKIKSRAQELEIEKSIVFFGNLEREQESKVLMASDVFLMPSLYEGVSIASVEAQMAGLQLFVSDTVDKDTNITGNVTFLSLEKNSKEWAKIILNSMSCGKKSYDYTVLLKKIRKAAYDMNYTTEMLMKMYILKGKTN